MTVTAEGEIVGDEWHPHHKRRIIEANVNHHGHGRVMLNGHDVSDAIVGATITLETGCPPRTALYVDSAIGVTLDDVELDGVTDLSAPGPTDLIAAVEQLDPDELRRRVIDRSNMGTDWPVPALETVAELLRERFNVGD